MNKGERLRSGDNAAVAVTATIAKHDDVARLCGLDLGAMIKNKTEIALVAPMTMPISSAFKLALDASVTEYWLSTKTSGM